MRERDGPIRIVVPGPNPRKNAKGTIGRSRSTGKPRRITPKAVATWYANLTLAVAESIRAQPRKLAKSGAWMLDVIVYEDELRHLDVDVPHGDIDSTVIAVLDGLQPKHCGPWAPLDDDARVIEMRVRKRYDPARPRVEITLTETDPEEIYLTTTPTLK